MNDIFTFGRHDRVGTGLWFDFLIADDYYFNVPPFKKKYNPHRKRRVHIGITLLKWEIIISIPFKHIGEKITRKKTNEK